MERGPSLQDFATGAQRFTKAGLDRSIQTLRASTASRDFSAYRLINAVTFQAQAGKDFHRAGNTNGLGGMLAPVPASAREFASEAGAQGFPAKSRLEYGQSVLRTGDNFRSGVKIGLDNPPLEGQGRFS
jgi:hypothetical protein